MTIPFAIGTRVELSTGIEHFPIGIFDKGETGTVSHYGDDDTLCYVKMDRDFPALETWDNCLEICDWNRLNNDEGDVRIQDQIEAL